VSLVESWCSSVKGAVKVTVLLSKLTQFVEQNDLTFYNTEDRVKLSTTTLHC